MCKTSNFSINSNMKCVLCWVIFWKCMTKPVHSEVSANLGLSTIQVIRGNGYPLEIFANIPTEDNYLLDVYRIPHGKLKKVNYSGPAVVLMSGLFGTSFDFVVSGPKRGLAYLLADRGYDVWLANARGTVNSRKHLLLNPDVDAEFWDFSWHEIGIYDLPAIFALVRNVTRKQQLSYIGVSEGTTVFYVLASVRPEYNKNINVMVSLAPGAYMKHLNPILKLLSIFEPSLTPLAKSLGINEFPPQFIQRLLLLAVRIFCPIEGFFQEICASILFVTGGYDPVQLNKTILPASFGESRITSTRQLLHYAQNINTGEFRQYNYGLEGNLKRYGSAQPPSYNVSKIVAPIAVFYAEMDWLSHFKDTERLLRELPNCVYKYKVPYKQFNHFDFFLANDVVKLVYESVLHVLDACNKDIKPC